MLMPSSEYITGDRFSPEFIDKRRVDLQRFLERIARHPILHRSKLVRAFLESTEWNVQMHQHLAHPPGPDPHPPSMIDNISDSLLNAFKTVRKPDERFVGMREGLERFEEGLSHKRFKYAREAWFALNLLVFQQIIDEDIAKMVHLGWYMVDEERLQELRHAKEETKWRKTSPNHINAMLRERIQGIVPHALR